MRKASSLKKYIGSLLSGSRSESLHAHTSSGTNLLDYKAPYSYRASNFNERTTDNSLYLNLDPAPYSSFVGPSCIISYGFDAFTVDLFDVSPDEPKPTADTPAKLLAEQRTKLMEDLATRRIGYSGDESYRLEAMQNAALRYEEWSKKKEELGFDASDREVLAAMLLSTISMDRKRPPTHNMNGKNELSVDLGLQPPRQKPLIQLVRATGTICQVLVLLACSAWYSGYLHISGPQGHPFNKPNNPFACWPPLPPVTRFVPPSHSDPEFVLASAALDASLSIRTALDDIDSLAISIVTPTGVVFERTYGALKANETSPEKRGRPDGNTLYRIASISKMFAVLELLILRDRGVLNWDDPVTRYISNFTHYEHGWADFLSNKTISPKPKDQIPITLRQLSSHMAGISRDFLRYPMDSWPKQDDFPATNSAEADLDFSEGDNTAGGQFSSLNDLKVVMRTFMNPESEDSLLSPQTVREWLRPLYVEPDSLTEVGAPWEITKLPDSYGIQRRFFSKGGNLFRYHSTFTFNPDASFGVIVLMTGTYSAAGKVAQGAIQMFQSAFDHHLLRIAEHLYGGFWQSDDMKNIAVTYVEKGTLWLGRLVLNGIDVFAQLEDKVPSSRRYAIWSTGRFDELRIAFGRPWAADDPLSGCISSWISMDSLYARGAPVDLLLFEGT
ncbi:hypothetical protein FRB99_008644 [Tulasnella sp. 403]|nr:hypothetical protein FRB99_008644 [Tulasnella sp. 403]